jgi:hypothetical protein
MSLISQFVTHFWSKGFVGFVGYYGVFSLYYLNSKRRWVGVLVRREQSTEYRVQSTEKYKINISDRIFILLHIV